MCVHVHALECACILATAWVEDHGQLGSWFSPFTTWTPGIELMPAGLAASILTH